MENSKYYTPKISEFHVGFDYEEQYNKKTPFFPEVVEANQDDYPDYDLLSHLAWKCEEEEVRVKYLGKTDIENLGWESQYVCKDDEECTIIEGYKFVINDLDEYVLYKEEEKYIIYFSHVYNEVSGNSEYSILYKGTLKNKNELQTLMRQLNII